MKPRTLRPSSFLRVIGEARQIVTVLDVGPVSAVCAIETVRPGGVVISQDRLTTIMRLAIPPHTLRIMAED